MARKIRRFSVTPLSHCRDFGMLAAAQFIPKLFACH
jgi:hypothetical protein